MKKQEKIIVPRKTIMSSEKKKKETLKKLIVCAAIAAFVVTLTPAMAAKSSIDYGGLTDILDTMISIIGTIFATVGVLLTAYSVGQLVLAFKNEDADGKSRASTQLVVGVVLIIMPTLIKSLDLVSMITK